MGAYNILFHFDKLNKRLGPLRRRFSRDKEPSEATPTLLFLSSTLAIIWMGIVLGFITLHEMGLGNRGSYELREFYMGHLIFGCFIPLVFSFLSNSDIWWSRRILIPLIIIFFTFYTLKLISLSWEPLYVSVFSIAWVSLGILFVLYLGFSSTANKYFSYLRRVDR